MTATDSLSLQFAHRLGLLGFSVLLALVVLELVRRGLLRERLALLWLATAAMGLLMGIFPRSIVVLAHLFHFQFITLVVVVESLFILGIVLAFSVSLSRLGNRNRRLAQEHALLARQVEQLEKRLQVVEQESLPGEKPAPGTKNRPASHPQPKR